MKPTSNIKDTLTSIAGACLLLSGAVLGASQYGIVLPSVVLGIAGSVATISGGVIAYLTGKNPDGSTKSPDQVANQNTQAK